MTWVFIDPRVRYVHGCLLVSVHFSYYKPRLRCTGFANTAVLSDIRTVKLLLEDIYPLLDTGSESDELLVLELQMHIKVTMYNASCLHGLRGRSILKTRN